MGEPVHYKVDAFPPPNLDWRRLNRLTGEANRVVGRFDSLARTIPNAEIVLSTLLMREVVYSSRIDGIWMTEGEVLEIEAGRKAKYSRNQLADAEEVANCSAAMRYGSRAVENRQLSLPLLREVHRVLMQGARGKQKRPGEFREEQNWIGRPGCSLETASYVPIHPSRLGAGLERWITYVGETEVEYDPLIRLAVVHAEFEALHPFLDGNGRTGRMIIPLFMAQHGLLVRPNYCLSDYLETHRAEYMQGLREISERGTWTDWCEFFLGAMIAQGKENCRRAERLHELYQSLHARVVEVTRSSHATGVVNLIFERPMFATRELTRYAGVPASSAARLLDRLVERGVLDVVRGGRGRRTGIYAFRPLLDTTREPSH